MGKVLSVFHDRFVGFWFAPADARMYAALRVAYAATSFVQCAGLWSLRAQWFSAEGMVSAHDSGPFGLLPPLFSYATSEAAVTAAFVVVLAAMAALAAGAASRVSAAIVAYWHYSLAFDLAPAISGYDMVLKLAGLILLFSPLGERWGIEGWWRRRRGKSAGAETAPAYGLYLIRWQLLLIYVSTVWLKLPDVHWRNGQFAAYFMLSWYSRLRSPWFAHAEALSVAATYATLAAELLIPLFLFSRRYRWAGVALGVGLHAGIALTSNLWLFSAAMLSLYPAFVSGADLRRWRDGLRSLAAEVA